MSQRPVDPTIIFKYILVLVIYTDPSWRAVHGVAVKPPPKTHSPIEAQAKFFQYRNFPTHEDFDQGHRLGSERHFTERHEKARPSEGLFSAKVRWGDKKGGYGEHYWDLNHAGHAGDHSDHGDDDHYNDRSDDGSYHHNDDNNNNGYEVSNDHSPIYGNDDYDPEKSSYEENGRAKRAQPRVKSERRPHKEVYVNDEETNTQKPKYRKNKEKLQEAPTHKVEKYSAEDEDDGEIEEEEEEVYRKPKRTHQRHPQVEQENLQPKEPKNQLVLVVKEKDRQNQDQNLYPNNQEYTHQVPYEGGAGVRQHHQAEVTAAATVPRLFLEPSTGHVVDRATGQAYVLQPIAANY